MMGSKDGVSLDLNISSDQNVFSEPEEYVLDSFVLPTNSSLDFHPRYSPKVARKSKKINSKSKSKISLTNGNAVETSLSSATTITATSNRFTQSTSGDDLYGSLRKDKLVNGTSGHYFTASQPLYENHLPLLENASTQGARPTSNHRNPLNLHHDDQSSSQYYDQVGSYGNGCSSTIGHNQSTSLTADNNDNASRSDQCIFSTNSRGRHEGPQECSCRSCLSKVKNTGNRVSLSNFASFPKELNGEMVELKSDKRHRRTNQAPFLKTISIIDTLSELGAAVKQLTEESKPVDTSLPSDTNMVRPNDPSTGFIVRGHHREKGQRTPNGLEEYTERVYEMVTKHSTSRKKNSKKSNKKLPKMLIEEDFSDLRYGIDGDAHSIPFFPADGKSLQTTGKRRQKGRTPDWIKKIFKIAKKGDLEALKQAIFDMEETLVRNITDHSGNNLLHAVAVFGHLIPLIWLLTTHKLLVDALQDENKFGLTPVVCSIKYGRLHILRWLVENTVVREKMRCRDGERSLLHLAAKYAQIEILSWLVSHMMTNEIPLDDIDHHGNTSLHLASRSGNSRLCSILLQHGADVTIKNEFGQKAWEVCASRGHLACAEYLCVHESGLSLATDLTRTEAELETSMSDNKDLRFNFREVVSIARRLLKDRDEVVRELSRLQDQMMKIRSHVSKLQENSNGFVNVRSSEERQKSHGTSNEDQRHAIIEDLASQFKNLQDRWVQLHKTWFSSSLVNTKHKMLLVEEAWKRLKLREHRTVATTHHPLDVFRAKLCSIRAQGNDQSNAIDVASLNSSQESLLSKLPFTDDEELFNGEMQYGMIYSSTPENTSRLLKPTSGSRKVGERGNDDSCSSFFSPSSLNSPADFFSNKKLRSGAKANSAPVTQEAMSPNYNTDKTESSLRYRDLASHSETLINSLSPCNSRIVEKDELSAKMKEFTLTSDSGSCSVLEVIEPLSDEGNDYYEEAKRSVADSGSSCNGKEDKYNRPPKTSRNGASRRIHGDSNSNVKHQDEHLQERVTINKEINTASPKEVEESIRRENNNHFLVYETSAGAAASDVSVSMQRSQSIEEEQSNTRSSLTNSLETEIVLGGTLKRKGFLQKLMKGNGWPTKKKEKGSRKRNTATSQNDQLICDTELKNDEFTAIDGTEWKEQTNNFSSQETNPPTPDDYSVVSASGYDRFMRSTERTSEEPFRPSLSISENDVRTINVEEEMAVDDRLSPHILPLPPLDSSSSLAPPPLPSPRTTVVSTLTSASQTNQIKNHFDDQVENSERKLLENNVEFHETSEGNCSGHRPASSASKSDLISSTDSPLSSLQTFKTDFSLHKNEISLTQDMLPAPEPNLTGRMSPAPSEVSKTESALSPPSHSSDISKSESSRQASLIETAHSNDDGAKPQAEFHAQYVTSIDEEPTDVKTAKVVSVEESKKTSSDCEPSGNSVSDHNSVSSKDHRPWYEISDEESDFLLRAPSGPVRNSSSEDEIEMR